MRIESPTPVSWFDVLNKHPVVPEFQRSYSWGTDNVKELIESILSFADGDLNDNLFLGQLLGFAISDDAAVPSKKLGIVDGQQRIATLSIAAAAIRDLLEKDGAKEEAADVQNRLIWPNKTAATKADHPYVRLNSYDGTFFRDNIQGIPMNLDAKPQMASHSSIIDAARTSLKMIEDWAREPEGEFSTEKIYTLRQVIERQIQVILVIGDGQDGASDLFEVLNYRSVQLNTLDLLKNFLTGRANSTSDAREIVSSLEPIFAMGADDGVAATDFLRHHWTALHGDLKSQLYRELRAVYSVDIRSGRTANDIAIELGRRAESYKQLVEASTGHTGLDKLLADVRYSQAGGRLYPLLLAGVDPFNNDERCKIARAGMVLFTRWSVIGRKDSSDLEKILFGLAKRVTEGNVTALEVVQEIIASCPSDSQFKEAFKGASISKPAWRRYVLFRLEQQERHDKKKEELKVDPMTCQVEHIYPQNPALAERVEDHEFLINRIGNLTLLGKRINNKAKNKVFESKREDHYGESEILLTKDLLNQQKWKKQKWGKAEIVKREEELSELAVKAWPLK